MDHAGQVKRSNPPAFAQPISRHAACSLKCSNIQGGVGLRDLPRPPSHLETESFSGQVTCEKSPAWPY